MEMNATIIASCLVIFFELRAIFALADRVWKIQYGRIKAQNTAIKEG